MRGTAGIAALAVIAASLTGTPPASAQQAPPRKPAATVAEVARGLASDDPTARRTAAAALGTRWPDGAVGVPSLLEALDDEDVGVRTAAAASLEALAERAVAPLSAYLDSLAPPAKGRAGGVEFMEGLANYLDYLGPAATPMEFATGLGSKDPAERRATLALLAVSPFPWSEALAQETAIRLIADPTTAELAGATVALSGWAAARRRGAAAARTPAEVPPRWLAALRSDVRTVRRLAASLIAMRDRGGPAAAEALQLALQAERARKDADPRVASDLGFALGKASDVRTVVAKGFPPAVAAAEELHRDFAGGLCAGAAGEDLVALLDLPWGRDPAAMQIAGARATPPAAEAALRGILRSGTGPLAAAAFALSRLRIRDADLATALDAVAKQCVADERKFDAADAALAAYWIGGATAERASTLRSAAGRNERDSFENVRGVCEWMGPEATRVYAVFRGLGAERVKGWVRIAAALGPEAKDWAADLVKGAQKAAVENLPGEPADPAMDAAYDHLETLGRVASLRALAAIGPAAAGVLSDVDRLRSDPDPRIALLAARASRSR